jgi:Domain of unknown function (DUF6285)
MRWATPPRHSSGRSDGWPRTGRLRRDRAAFRWWLTLATLRWGVICRFQAERHLSGQSPSVELAAIGRRVSETEWDVLDLLSGGQERWGHSPRKRGAHPLKAQGDDPGIRRSGGPQMNLYGRPTAAELVAAVADFLDNDVRAATDGQVTFHARVAANVLRIVERELGASAGEVPHALADLGYADEETLAAAIRAGELDDRSGDLLACLRTLVRHRLAVAHPGYDQT